MEDHSDHSNPAESEAQLTHDAKPLARFAQLIAEIDHLGQLPVTQHRDVYERAHQQLTESLDEIARS
ncbi:MAG: hypothetical protein ABI137_10590 [Antricoccus sp.]